MVELSLQIERYDCADGNCIRDGWVFGIVEHTVDWPERLVALAEVDEPTRGCDMQRLRKCTSLSGMRPENMEYPVSQDRTVLRGPAHRTVTEET